MGEPNHKQTPELRDVTIADQGNLMTINYSDLEEFHTGDSWFGCTVGFRAMQVASGILSVNSMWDRDNLYIVSAHPGQGVLDAIEFVTCCITKNRFSLTPEVANSVNCNRDMKFEWWISDGRWTTDIKLRHGIVPNSFYDLLDRIGTPQEKQQDKESFKTFKLEMKEKLWQESLQSIFYVEKFDKPLSVGDIPNA